MNKDSKSTSGGFSEQILGVFSSDYVTLDITSSDVRVMSVRNKQIRKWYSEPLSEGVVRDGIIIEPQTLSLVLNEMFKSLKLRKNRVICTVNGLPFIYRSIGMPDTEKPIDKESLERAARKEMSLTEPEMHLFWQATDTNQEKKEKNYFITGIPRNAIKPLMETLRNSHIKPYLMDIKPLALARLASMREAILISMEKRYIDVVVISGGLVRVMHSFDSKSKPEDINPLITEITNGLNKAENSYNRDFPQNPIPVETPIVLSGELATGNDIPRLLQQISGHPVSLITSPLRTPPEFPICQYAGNIGLYLKKSPHPSEPSGAVRYQDINMDLLAGIRPPSAFQLKQSDAVIGLVIIVLAGLAFYAYTLDTGSKNEVNSLKAQSASVSMQLTKAQKANKDALAQQKTEKENLAAVQSKLTALKDTNSYIGSLKKDYAGRIEFIAGALPSLSQYQAMHLDKASMTVSGSASVAASVLNFTGNMEASNKITSARINAIGPGQDNVGIVFEVDIKE